MWIEDIPSYRRPQSVLVHIRLRARSVTGNRSPLDESASASPAGHYPYAPVLDTRTHATRVADCGAGAIVATVRSKGITKKTSLSGPQKGPCWPSLHEEYQKDVPFWTTKGAILACLTWGLPKRRPFLDHKTTHFCLPYMVITKKTRGVFFVIPLYDGQKDAQIENNGERLFGNPLENWPKRRQIGE